MCPLAAGTQPAPCAVPLLGHPQHPAPYPGDEASCGNSAQHAVCSHSFVCLLVVTNA